MSGMLLDTVVLEPI